MSKKINSGPLLRWYARVARDLPWRRTRDPYSIWVSEIMLQQTRVSTVIPYYERFIAKFPSIETLASAHEDEVLALWSGLGYYRRARLLHQGVREVVARYGGKVPEDQAARLSLPGVGRYTAGAIGSISFNKAEPVVDGNVARVLSRLHAIDTPVGQRETEHRLWSAATEWVQSGEPRSINQALMELGATVCLPRAPRCDECPLQDGCAAKQKKLVNVLPVSRTRKPPIGVHLVAVIPVDSKHGDIWFVRGKQELYGGLWSVPMIEIDESPSDAAWRALQQYSIQARELAQSNIQVEHTLSHRKLRVHVYTASDVTARSDHDRKRISVHQLHSVGVSRLTLKILDGIGRIEDVASH